MVEEIATVVANESAGVWLVTTPAGSCNSCNVSQDCGTGIVAKTFTPRQNRFFVKTPLNLLPGEQVQIGVAEQGLVLAALMVYLLPLILMLTTLLMLQSLWQPAEGWLLLSAALSAAFGFFLARLYNNKVQQQQEPVQILRVLSQLKVTNAVSDAQQP
ncbi:sigma-E factor regulatory protein RseC [Alishewanella longhuensis]|uniref:Sigma-E factor regulatory protein RseC n=1 Tax=Alishewanella longhuensis TaxID=1091037 RepID=A0ABQ3KX90_9ALTE|nr:SoxR reducing system RseC family protein [Alishewanella longhuensis]GHG65192.1 sigma-E factor regulatory protein RseC [Alishewanella longhuensis]